ncbi:T9SS type A sorting domain-containing protein [bacterium]|nr:T9SS type A sorting domain-containing protein [bacterium]MBU1984364.1 T9SS type A sorting domain-containing protein [bacterium]
MSGKLRFSFVLILSLSLYTGVVGAQDNHNITCIHQYYHNWQDGVYDVTVQNNIAYLACGSEGLRIVDLSNPSAPVDLGQLPFEWTQTVTVAGDFAYVGTGGSLRVIDVSNPAQPLEIPQVPIQCSANAIQIVDNFAFVAASPGPLFLDITDPAEPVVIWSSSEYRSLDIEVHGNFAYLAGDDPGLFVLDITELNSPLVVGNYRSGWEEVRGVSVSGHYAFLACGWNGLEVVDLSTMQMVASIESLSYAFGVDVVDGYAYVNYGDPECPLAIVDISNPLAPQTVGVYYPPSDLISFEVAGDLVYVADRYHGLRTVDVSVPSNPQEIHRYNRYGHDLDVIVSGNRAYVQEDYKLQIVDITDLENPQELGYYEMSLPYREYTLVGNVVYAHGYNCIHAVDISDAFNPSLIGTFRSSDNQGMHSMVVYDHYGYVVKNDGLCVIDITDPTNLREVGYFHRDIGNAKITISGHYAFLLGNFDDLLIVLDLSNPRTPTMLCSYQLDDFYDQCVDMEVSNGVLYVASRIQLWAFDATSFTHWTPLAEISLYGQFGIDIRSLSIQGEYVYVTAHPNRLYIFDMTDPTAPHITGCYQTPGLPYAVTVMGNIAVVADYDNLGFYNCSGALPSGERRAPENPQAFAVSPAYPNPFNSSTQIPFEIAAQNRVTISIFDVLGRTVTTLTDQEFAAGRHTLRWDGMDESGRMVASGRYFVQVRSGDVIRNVPILYLK